MKKLITLISLLLFAQSALAADQTIEMLNKLGKEHMVYSQKIVNITNVIQIMRYVQTVIDNLNLNYINEPNILIFRIVI